MYYGERLNSISHLVGAVFALIGLGAALAVSIGTGDGWTIASFTVFGLTMVLLYTMSTLYHSFSPPRLKRLFQLFDHISIYLLIAGTYTPYMLVSLRDTNGWMMLGFVWLLALVGILSEIFMSGKLVKAGQLAIYLGMGWTATFEFDNLRTAITDAGVFWLVTGGLAYTFGVVFYLLDDLNKLKHAHGIWHFFVLAGTTSHFISIIVYVR